MYHWGKRIHDDNPTWKHGQFIGPVQGTLLLTVIRVLRLLGVIRLVTVSLLIGLLVFRRARFFFLVIRIIDGRSWVWLRDQYQGGTIGMLKHGEDSPFVFQAAFLQQLVHLILAKAELSTDSFLLLRTKIQLLRLLRITGVFYGRAFLAVDCILRGDPPDFLVEFLQLVSQPMHLSEQFDKFGLLGRIHFTILIQLT